MWKAEDIRRLGKALTLFSERNIVTNFSNMGRASHAVPLVRSDLVPSPLPRGPDVQLPSEVDAWVQARAVTALVILKDGQIVHEAYHKGTGPDDLRINWSISKSYLSALFGVILSEGAIDRIDDPVVKHVPELVNTAYRDATIKDVLQMSTGVVFDEDYLAFFSDINKMGRLLALGGSMDDFTLQQDRSFAAPGTAWKYVSIDTHVLGMVIRRATGRDIPSLVNEKIIAPLRFEANPIYLTDGYGVAFVLGGLNTTTRDNARFGQMLANGGAWDGQQILPVDWVEASTIASAKTNPGEIGYGYQWWIPDGSQDGQFLGRGIYGQHLYIDRINDVVIAVHGADRGFREDGVQRQNEAMLRLIAESLD